MYELITIYNKKGVVGGTFFFLLGRWLLLMAAPPQLAFPGFSCQHAKYSNQ
jgi:hypothetical protein